MKFWDLFLALTSFWSVPTLVCFLYSTLLLIYCPTHVLHFPHSVHSKTEIVSRLSHFWWKNLVLIRKLFWFVFFRRRQEIYSSTRRKICIKMAPPIRTSIHIAASPSAVKNVVRTSLPVFSALFIILFHLLITPTSFKVFQLPRLHILAPIRQHVALYHPIIIQFPKIHVCAADRSR